MRRPQAESGRTAAPGATAPAERGPRVSNRVLAGEDLRARAQDSAHGPATMASGGVGESSLDGEGLEPKWLEPKWLN